MPWPVSFAKALGDCEASFSRLPVHPQAGSETRVQMSVVCLCVPRGWCSLENNFAVIQSRRGFTQPPVSVARLVIYIYSRAYVTYPCYKNVLKVYVNHLMAELSISNFKLKIHYYLLYTKIT